MKVKIISEPYYSTPAPKLTKKMFDWFWTNIWRVKQYICEIDYEIYLLEIRINQALPYTNVHFYVKLHTNSGVEQMHFTWDMTEGKYMGDYGERKNCVMRMLEETKDNFRRLSKQEQRAYQISKIMEL
jgi:hypothetical protein